MIIIIPAIARISVNFQLVFLKEILVQCCQCYNLIFETAVHMLFTVEVCNVDPLSG